ncbi:MAG: biopolymer transporter ExbD [Candidatus Omnitrophica bacterium]|jgi:biopolymer transport protein ExbD|nr:biopolymer transporter ExbD [Candidatus Omnitrophota bacterium]
MKFKRHIKLERTLKTIDIAPLIDVVFLLLIFFMLTSSFIFQPGIKVNLPRAITSEMLSEDNAVINITSENLIYYNQKLVTLRELNSLLKDVASSRLSVLIRSDRRASLGRIVEVWDMCRQEGIRQVNIATTQTAN